MPIGFMPYWSFEPVFASSDRRLSTVAKAYHPWWMGAAGGGSDGCSQNKLARQLDPAKMGACSSSFSCCCGGGGGDGIGRVLGFNRSAVASEMGSRRWTRSKSSRSDLGIFSTVVACEATAPTCAFGHRWMAAGLHHAVDCSGRRAAMWRLGIWICCLQSFLPARKPYGRQMGFGSASVSSSSGSGGQWSDGEVTIPSGSVPGDGNLGLCLKLRRWTVLESTTHVQGLLCKVRGLSCNFSFYEGPVVSCTGLQNL